MTMGDPQVVQPDEGKSLFPSPAERQAALRAIGGVCDLIADAGTLRERSPQAIVTHTNGYGCWFVPDTKEPWGTAALTPEEILARIEAFHAA